MKQVPAELTHDEVLDNVAAGLATLTLFSASVAEHDIDVAKLIAGWAAGWLRFMVAVNVLTFNEADALVHNNEAYLTAAMPEPPVVI